MTVELVDALLARVAHHRQQRESEIARLRERVAQLEALLGGDLGEDALICEVEEARHADRHLREAAAALGADVEKLERDVGNAAEEIEKMLDEHESRAARVRQGRAGWAEADAALTAFGEQVGAMSPAQKLGRMRELGMTAMSVRHWAHNKAGSLARMLEKGAVQLTKMNELQQEAFELDAAVRGTLARIRDRHGEVPLAEALCSPDTTAQVAKRICRDVLEPLFEDARIEQKMGLMTRDPVDPLALRLGGTSNA